MNLTGQYVVVCTSVLLFEGFSNQRNAHVTGRKNTTNTDFNGDCGEGGNEWILDGSNDNNS